METCTSYYEYVIFIEVLISKSICCFYRQNIRYQIIIEPCLSNLKSN